MFWNPWHIHPKAAERDGTVSPPHGEISVDKVVLSMHPCLGSFEYITLLANKSLPVHEGVY